VAAVSAVAAPPAKRDRNRATSRETEPAASRRAFFVDRLVEAQGAAGELIRRSSFLIFQRKIGRTEGWLGARRANRLETAQLPGIPVRLAPKNSRLHDLLTFL
jgi:hypothetical protein